MVLAIDEPPISAASIAALFKLQRLGVHQLPTPSSLDNKIVHATSVHSQGEEEYRTGEQLQGFVCALQQRPSKMNFSSKTRRLLLHI